MSKKLLKSTAIVATMTFVSRILGLVREIVFASCFGATAGMDAFLVAFKIPNFLRRMFAEGAFSQVFVPLLAEYKTNDEKQQMRDFVRVVAGTLALVVFVIALIGMAASAVFIFIFAPGFAHEPMKFHLATYMLRITFPYIFFISLTALSGGILNCYSRFAIPAITPALLNIALICAALFLAPHLTHPITALAWGVLIVGIVQLLFQFPSLKRLGLLIWPKWGFSHSGVKRLMKLMAPALFGASVVQVSLLVDTIFASFLHTGSVSWLYYSNRLMQFPLGVFGVALSTVVLPYLSTKHAKADAKGFNKSLDWALKWIVIIGLPSAVALIMLSGPLVVSIYNYGRFSSLDVLMSQNSLIAFSLGLVFFIAIKVLVSAFYARCDMKTPVKIGAIAVGLNIIFNGILIWPLAHVGIALATSLSAGFNVLMLLIVLLRRKIYQPQAGWIRVFGAVIMASVIMAIVIYLMNQGLNLWLNWHVYSRIWHLAIMVLVASFVYLISLLVFGLRKRYVSC